MQRSELDELHFITPVSNVASILNVGIVSHRLAEKLPHSSIAMEEIQDLRAGKKIPGGGELHSYANLYFHARNPMMWKRRDMHASMCVLRLSPDVLDLAGVVVTDANAASKYTRFEAAPGGLSIVDRERTFAQSWTDPDKFEYWRKKAAKCAEVLVPNRVPPRLIIGAHVSGPIGLASLQSHFTHPIAITPDLFFQ